MNSYVKARASEPLVSKTKMWTRRVKNGMCMRRYCFAMLGSEKNEIFAQPVTGISFRYSWFVRILIAQASGTNYCTNYYHVALSDPYLQDTTHGSFDTIYHTWQYYDKNDISILLMFAIALAPVFNTAHVLHDLHAQPRDRCQGSKTRSWKTSWPTQVAINFIKLSVKLRG